MTRIFPARRAVFFFPRPPAVDWGSCSYERMPYPCLFGYLYRLGIGVSVAGTHHRIAVDVAMDSDVGLVAVVLVHQRRRNADLRSRGLWILVRTERRVVWVCYCKG